MRNTVVVTVGNWLSKLLFLGFNIVVVRWLGEVGLGHYATVIAFVGLFGIMFNFGMSQHMERAIARDRDQAAMLFWNLIVLRLILAVVGVGLTTGIAALAGFDRRLVVGVLIYTLSYVLAAVQVPLTGVLRALERFDSVTTAMLVSRVISIIVALGLLWSGAWFFALLLAGFVAVPVQIWISAWVVRTMGIDLARRRVEPRGWLSMVRTGLPFGLLSLGLSFNANVITVVLGVFSGAANVGWYSAAYRLVFHAVGVLGGLLVVMMPSLTRMHAREPERVARWTSSTFDWLALVVLPLSAGLSLVAPRIVHLLYGASYAPAGPVLRILAWDIALMLAVAYFANVCAAVGLERSAARIYLGGIIVNAIVATATIAVFGRIGAAVVNIIVDGVSLMVFAVVLVRAGWVKFDLQKLWRITAVTVAMGVAVWFASALPLAIVIVAGAAVYGGMVLLLGLVDWRLLIAAARRRSSVSTGTNY